MQFIAVMTRKPEFAPQDFAPYLDEEGRRAIELYAAGTFRQIMSRTDGRGAVIVIEADDQAAAEAALRSLPLVERGMLTYDIYGVTAYRAFVQSLSKS